MIKTHHNRVAGIQKLIEEGRLVEPLASFYKDEVRAIGAPAWACRRSIWSGIRSRVPGWRSAVSAPTWKRNWSHAARRFWFPVRSVGVQGDFRTYAPVLATADFPSKTANLQSAATEMVNEFGRKSTA